jgi:hypothetical protein
VSHFAATICSPSEKSLVQFCVEKLMMKAKFVAFVLLLAGSQAAHAITITFDEFPADNDNGPMPSGRYAYLGVTFAGTDDGSTWGGNSVGNPGNWGLEGTNGRTFSGYNGDSYNLKLTSGGLFANFSLDVSRSNGSDVGNTFTLEGYVNSALVETTTIPLATINVWSKVSLTSIVDEIRWHGAGASFHPFGIDNLNFETVPESATGVLGTLALLGMPLFGTRARCRFA